MGSLRSFVEQLDWVGILMLLAGAAVSLVCITVHELSHGLTAYRLGDPTAKVNGRLTLNPLAHIDPVGLLMMLTVRVGWAKPVPVDMRNFQKPKRDMALTALAGPVSNFLLALGMLGLGSLLYRFAPDGQPLAYALFFCCYAAVLSVGLGLFNHATTCCLYRPWTAPKSCSPSCLTGCTARFCATSATSSWP